MSTMPISLSEIAIFLTAAVSLVALWRNIWDKRLDGLKADIQNLRTQVDNGFKEVYKEFRNVDIEFKEIRKDIAKIDTSLARLETRVDERTLRVIHTQIEPKKTPISAHEGEGVV